MARKRLTELFPFLLPLRKWQRKRCFYRKMRHDGAAYAVEIGEVLPYEIFRTASPMINENSGYDIKYQYNKAHNLKVAARKLDRLKIAPRETFSFCLAVRDADKDIPYKDGLNFSNGKMEGSYGGGLCQMSNVLHWVFLHSPLNITERHGHRIEAFAPASEDQLQGVDATVSEGWLDLKVRNDTEEVYQLAIEFDEETMYAALRCETSPTWEYEIYNSAVEHFYEKGKTFCKARVDRRRRALSDGQVREEHLYENICEIGYTVKEENK